MQFYDNTEFYLRYNDDVPEKINLLISSVSYIMLPLFHKSSNNLHNSSALGQFKGLASQH